MKSLGLLEFNRSHPRRSIIAGLNTGAFTRRRPVGFTALALAAGPLRITRAEESNARDVNLDGVKAYVVDQASEMKK